MPYVQTGFILSTAVLFVNR